MHPFRWLHGPGCRVPLDQRPRSQHCFRHETFPVRPHIDSHWQRHSPTEQGKTLYTLGQLSLAGQSFSFEMMHHQWNTSLSRRNSRHFLFGPTLFIMRRCGLDMLQLLFFGSLVFLKTYWLTMCIFCLFAAAHGQFCYSGVWAVHSLSSHFMGVVLAQQRGNIRQNLVRYVFWFTLMLV